MRIFYILMSLFFLALSACEIHDLNELGALVPLTADQNPALQRMQIEVANTSRWVHYKNFGNPTNPVFFVIHGSLSDMTPYLPLSALSNHYYVVMWDMRGNGLSERASGTELEPENMVEEIQAMKEAFSPGNRVSILGHSWSAVFVAMYLAKYPDNIQQAVLLEPNGFKDEWQATVGLALNLFSYGFSDMAWLSEVLTPKDHASLDYRVLAMLKSGVRDFFYDSDNPPEWPVNRVGGYALMIWENSIMDGTSFNFDFTPGMIDYPREVLFVGTSHSPIGYEFQKNYNSTAFQQTRILRIEKCGHRILTERFSELWAGLTNYLEQY